MKIFEEFAAICKKYNLPKDINTFRLFCVYEKIAYHISIGQYEENEFSNLEAARLIRLISRGSGLKLSSAEGASVDIDNSILKACLFMYLNTELERNAGLLYSVMGIAGDKKGIKSGAEYMGEIFGKEGEYTEPYTEEELQKIIDFEGKQAKKESLMQGNEGKGIPKLGYYASSLNWVLTAGEEHKEGEEASTFSSLNESSKLNLIADLLEAAGVLADFKGQIWLQESWEAMTKKERANEVRGWLKSYKKKLESFPQHEAGNVYNTLKEFRQIQIMQAQRLKEEFSKLSFD